MRSNINRFKINAKCENYDQTVHKSIYLLYIYAHYITLYLVFFFNITLKI